VLDIKLLNKITNNMINFFLTLISCAVFSFGNINNQQDFYVQLVNIEYYSFCDCSENSPILVRIKFKVENAEISDLKMIIKYPTDITVTTKIKEKDDSENIVYSFCTKKESIVEFNAYFIQSNGLKSNEINIKSKLSDAVIYETIPPILSIIN